MKTILVALDDSPRAAEVLRTAREMAQKMGAKLHLFRAVTLPAGLPPEAYAFPPDDLEALLKREAERELEGLARELPEAVRGQLLVGLGSPWRAICATAQEIAADLVVVGSHGFGGIDRLLGTTAVKVVNHADRPVLVVRHPPPRL